MKKILMIAYHYPPLGGGSGIHRTLKFSSYLADYGWAPIVLTASPRAYPRTEEREGEIPSHVVLARAAALDTARHFSIRGAYANWMAVPDRWISWWPGAVALGADLIDQHRPDVIWSTYPIATAHLIGLTLHRLSGIPWVADFRDPMTETDPITGDVFPADPLVRRAASWIETRTVKHSTRAIFTTPGTLAMYADRFPKAKQDRWSVIHNGFDEQDFINAERRLGARRKRPGEPLTLLHSGTLYPLERDPTAFFEALADLRNAGKVNGSTLKVILRATGNDEDYRKRIGRLGIDDIVSIAPPIPYADALVEMMESDGLLIFQATNCNRQIPAKAYECLRAQRPIFAMTDPAGDTAAFLRSEGIESIVSLQSKQEIADGLVRFLGRITGGSACPNRTPVDRFSRKARTKELAALLDSVC